MEGYFKVHRRILDSQVFAHQTALKIWVWCLAKVTFKERFVPLKSGKGTITVKLSPGQFLFGRFKAEEELNIDGSTIYKWMQKFASDEFDMIKIESNNQYSIVTISKWEEYQNGDSDEVTTEEQPKDNQVTAKGQPSNSRVTHTRMYNNDKKVKKVANNQTNDSINFYIEQVNKAKGFTDKMSEDYVTLCRHICQKNEDGTWRMANLLKVKNQLSLNDFSKLYEKTNGNLELIMSKVDSFQTNVNYYKKYIDIYLSVNKWLNDK